MKTNSKQHKQAVRLWLSSRLTRFKAAPRFKTDSVENLIKELRTIADEAEARLNNPNFPLL